MIKLRFKFNLLNSVQFSFVYHCKLHCHLSVYVHTHMHLGAILASSLNSRMKGEYDVIQSCCLESIFLKKLVDCLILTFQSNFCGDFCGKVLFTSTGLFRMKGEYDVVQSCCSESIFLKKLVDCLEESIFLQNEMT